MEIQHPHYCPSCRIRREAWQLAEGSDSQGVLAKGERLPPKLAGFVDHLQQSDSLLQHPAAKVDPRFGRVEATPEILTDECPSCGADASGRLLLERTGDGEFAVFSALEAGEWDALVERLEAVAARKDG